MIPGRLRRESLPGGDLEQYECDGDCWCQEGSNQGGKLRTSLCNTSSAPGRGASARTNSHWPLLLPLDRRAEENKEMHSIEEATPRHKGLCPRDERKFFNCQEIWNVPTFSPDIRDVFFHVHDREVAEGNGTALESMPTWNECYHLLDCSTCLAWLLAMGLCIALLRN